MKKGFAIIAMLLSVLFYGNALAVDDSDIQRMKKGLPAIEERVSTIEDRLAGICESCG